MTRWLLILLLLPVAAWGSQHTATTLPYSSVGGTSGNWDTLTLAGTKLSSLTNGIALNSYTYLNLGTDTIAFGTNTSNDNYGLFMNYQAHDIIVHGGWIIYDPDSIPWDDDWVNDLGLGYSLPATNNGNRNVRSNGYNYNILIDSVSMIAGGWNAHIVSWPSGYINYQWEIRGGDYWNNCTGFYDRCGGSAVSFVLETAQRDTVIYNFSGHADSVIVFYTHYKPYADVCYEVYTTLCLVDTLVDQTDSATYIPYPIRGGVEYYYSAIVIEDGNRDTIPTDSTYNYCNGTYCAKIHDINIHNSPHAAIRCYANSEVYGCSINVDVQNVLYEYYTGNFCKGAANADGISLQFAGPGASIHDNVITASTTHNGGRGIQIEGPCYGLADSTVDVYNNYILSYQGNDAYYELIKGAAFKIRNPCTYINVYDNTFIGYSKGAACGDATCRNADTILWVDGRTESFYNSLSTITDWATYSPGAPANCVFENNNIICLALDNLAEANGMSFEKLGEGSTITSNIWRYNKIQCNSEGIRFGEYNGRACNLTMYGDTIVGIDSSYRADFKTIYFYTPACSNIVLQDYVFQGLAEDKDVNYGPSISGCDIAFERTLKVLVLDVLGNKQAGAVLKVTNNYSQIEGYDTSGADGIAGVMCRYHHDFSDISDSTGYNPFDFIVYSGADTATVLNFVLSDSIFTDTVVLAIVANHNACTVFDDTIPANWIDSAAANLDIYYAHTSHGSQLITGLTMIEDEDASYDPPTIHEVNDDLGYNGDTTWVADIRSYLNAHSEIDVVMISWCLGLITASEASVNVYLNKMNQLEGDYPEVYFVYWTGPLDEYGSTGNRALRNIQIRNYCLTNNKVLYDFEDVEKYNPDGDYFPEGTDACVWCADWCDEHDCPDTCYCAHSHHFNCYQKGKALWWLMARLVGWQSAEGEEPPIPDSTISQDFACTDTTDDSIELTVDITQENCEPDSIILKCGATSNKNSNPSDPHVYTFEGLDAGTEYKCIATTYAPCDIIADTLDITTDAEPPASSAKRLPIRRP